jgi:hypothetical protein
MDRGSIPMIDITPPGDSNGAASRMNARGSSKMMNSINTADQVE